MTTIASTPPVPAKTQTSTSSTTVTGPSPVERAKERPSRQNDAERPGDNKTDGSAPEELSDEMLLKVVRAISGERGAIVDRKV